MILRVSKLSKHFNGFSALTDISFELPKDRVLAVLGPSGSGKTTLLRCIAGFEQLSSGTIDYAFRDNRVHIDTSIISPVSFLCRRVGFVFQDLQLWPNKSVLGNLIEAPLTVLRKKRSDAISEAETICVELGIADQMHKLPTQLSVGQQQRVCIARSLIMQPQVILMDEITSALDPPQARNLSHLLKRLHEERGISIIFVSHDISFSKELADDMLFLKDSKLSYHGEFPIKDNYLKLPNDVHAFFSDDENSTIGGTNG